MWLKCEAVTGVSWGRRNSGECFETRHGPSGSRLTPACDGSPLVFFRFGLSWNLVYFFADGFHDALQRLGNYEALFADLNSRGGSVCEAWIIYDYLIIGPASQRPSLVLITGECSGAAILVAMGFKQIYMLSGACMGFEPVTLSNAATSRRATKTVARVIAKRTKSDARGIFQWMRERRTFFSEECLECRLCDAVV